MAKALTERQPTLPGWQRLPPELIHPELRHGARGVSAWRNGTTWVISALVEAQLPDGSGLGLHWHLSISRRTGSNPRRPQLQDVRRARRAFGMQQAEEDNHHPGVAKHLFLVVDPAKWVDCECKTDETVVTEKDGYRWTNPKEGPCRGCELAELTGPPCPLHPRPPSQGHLQPEGQCPVAAGGSAP